MAYSSRFNGVDLLITQLQPLVMPTTDPLILSSWAGIIAVEAITAYELAIKDICEDFAKRKHKVFATFVKSSYSRLNGRISYKDIRAGIVKPYGDKYLKRLVNKTDNKTKVVMATEKVDLVRTYDNLITCRHQFVHAGVLTMSFSEAVKSYQIGKNLIDVIHETMNH